MANQTSKLEAAALALGAIRRPTRGGNIRYLFQKDLLMFEDFNLEGFASPSAGYGDENKISGVQLCSPRGERISVDGKSVILGKSQKWQLNIFPRLSCEENCYQVRKITFRSNKWHLDYSLQLDSMRKGGGANFVTHTREIWDRGEAYPLSEALSALQKIHPLWTQNTFLAEHSQGLKKKVEAAIGKFGRLLASHGERSTSNLAAGQEHAISQARAISI